MFNPTLISLQEYINVQIETSDSMKDREKKWNGRNLVYNLMDLSAEVENMFNYMVDHDKICTEENFDKFHDLCCCVYNDIRASYGLKRALKIAEWEWYDFWVGENTLGNSLNSIGTWWVQWYTTNALN